MRVLFISDYQIFAQKPIKVINKKVSNPYSLSKLILDIDPDIIVSHKDGDTLIPSSINLFPIHRTPVSNGDITDSHLNILANIARVYELPYIHIQTNDLTIIEEMLKKIKKTEHHEVYNG